MSNQKYFIKDVALTKKEDDSFHHIHYVNNLKKIIEDYDPPFNIALIGKWGVGKSTIINLLKKEFNQKNEYKIHEINAWKYEDESLKKAFLKKLWLTFNGEKDELFRDNINNQIKVIKATTENRLEPESFKPLFKRVLPTFFNIGVISLFISLLILCMFLLFAILPQFNLESVLKKFYDNIWMSLVLGTIITTVIQMIYSYSQKPSTHIQLTKPLETSDEYEELFKAEIRKYKKKHPEFKKMVVVIDDLDRLSPKKMVDALDAIKAFVDIQECIFIVSCDEDIVKKALRKKKFNDIIDGPDTDLFLDKLFQFRIHMAPILESDMREYALELVKQEATDLLEFYSGNFEDIINILIHPEVSTPRHVKKIINTFANNIIIMSQRKGIKIEENILTDQNSVQIIAKLSVIQSDFEELFEDMYVNREIEKEIIEAYQNKDVEFGYLNKYFDVRKGKLIPKEESLINFLMKTSYLKTEYLETYLYLGQERVGLETGIKNFKRIQNAVISGNGFLLKEENLLNEENAYRVLELILRTVTNRDLVAVIQVSLDFVDTVKKDYEERFAILINNKILQVGLNSNYNFDKLDIKSVIKVTSLTGYNENMLNFINIFLEDQLKNLKHQNQERLYLFLDNIFKDDQLITCNSIKDNIYDLLDIKEKHYSVFSVEFILELYNNHTSIIKNQFLIPFFKSLVGEKENDKYLGIIEEILDTPEAKEGLLDLYILELMRNEKIAYKLMDVFMDKNIRIFSKENTNLFDILASYSEIEDNSIRVLNYLIGLEFSEDVDWNIDDFDRILYFLCSEETEIQGIILKLIKKVLPLEEIGVKELPDFTDYILKDFEKNKDRYSYLIANLLDYLSDTQKQRVKNVLIQDVQMGVSKFGILPSFIANLPEKALTEEFLNNILYTANSALNTHKHQIQNYKDWLKNFALIVKNIVKIEYQDIYINILETLKNLIADSEMRDEMLNLLISWGDLTDDNFIKNNYSTLLSSNYDKNNIQLPYDFIKKYSRRCNKLLENKDELNLKFYISNFSRDPVLALEAISRYSNLGEEDNFLQLYKNIETLTLDFLKSHIITLEKISALYNNYDDETQLSIFLELLSIFESERLALCMPILEQKIEILAGELINQEEQFLSKLKILELLGIFGIKSVNLIGDYLVELLNNVKDENVISLKIVCEKYYKHLNLMHKKQDVFCSLVSSFKKLNLEKKTNLLDIVVMYSMQKDLQDRLFNEEFSSEEEQLIKEKLNLRDKRSLLKRV